MIAQVPGSSSFRFSELTIDSAHAAIRAGEVTAYELVELYLKRIDAYDRSGPRINSVVRVNPTALEDARGADEHLARTGQLIGPLHGIPVAIKDQIDTAGLETNYGSICFRGYVPAADARIIQRLRAAGAIVLAKTLLADFAASWFALSSAGGDTRSPYALDRNAGGSSGGSAAAVAANLALVGIGEDTGGSIRLPASFNNLVGFRVTTGLISRAGVSPLLSAQDTAGPMTRCVRDAAHLLDALIGYDEDDPVTEINNRLGAGSFVNALGAHPMRGSRIGVVRSLSGNFPHPEANEVASVFQAAVDDLQRLGADLEEVEIADLSDHLRESSLYLLASKADLNRWLGRLPDAPVRSLAEIIESGRYHPLLDLIPRIGQGPDDPPSDPGYLAAVGGQVNLRTAIEGLMYSMGLSALAFPTVQVPAPRSADLYAGVWETLTYPTNTVIASQAGLPAVSVPVGFTPSGLPVGLELVGRRLDDHRLLGLAYDLEQGTQHRRAPDTTPPLQGEP